MASTTKLPGMGSPNDDLTSVAIAVRDMMDRLQMTLAVMESVTSGGIASTLTDVPDSGYLIGGAVAYDAGAKVRFGVPTSTIEECGLVSPETALEMARAARRWFKTDVGVGITGVAGPEAELGYEPGSAYIGIVTPARAFCAGVKVNGSDRREVKTELALEALGLLISQLEAVETGRFGDGCASDE